MGGAPEVLYGASNRAAGHPEALAPRGCVGGAQAARTRGAGCSRGRGAHLLPAVSAAGGGRAAAGGAMRLGCGAFAAGCVVIEVLGVALFLRGFFPPPVRSSSKPEPPAAPEPSAGRAPLPARSFAGGPSS